MWWPFWILKHSQTVSCLFSQLNSSKRRHLISTTSSLFHLYYVYFCLNYNMYCHTHDYHQPFLLYSLSLAYLIFRMDLGYDLSEFTWWSASPPTRYVDALQTRMLLCFVFLIAYTTSGLINLYQVKMIKKICQTLECFCWIFKI